MQQTTKAIVLRAIKYGDSSLIVKAFTASSGIKSYLLQGILSQKRGKLNKAHFMPLTQLEIIAQHKEKGGLERISEARIFFPYQTIHFDMAKNAMVLFLAEFLTNAIQEEAENEPLFSFIELALQWLDTHEKTANFHLFFLVTISRYFGFYPSEDHKDAPYFDLVEGAFVDRLSLHPCIQEPEISYFKSILGINFDTLSDVKMSQQIRRELLKYLMIYYKHHLDGFRTPKSIHILNEVFS
tara:strand:+ start:1596 stop:2315 length:720 start_codon:yes stop_codon:yes gene_type:complete